MPPSPMRASTSYLLPMTVLLWEPLIDWRDRSVDGGRPKNESCATDSGSGGRTGVGAGAGARTARCAADGVSFTGETSGSLTCGYDPDGGGVGVLRRMVCAAASPELGRS